MNSRDFCYWLQGIFEVADPKELNERATTLIKAHLNMVFIHEIDPSFPSEQQTALDTAHWPDGKSPTFPAKGTNSMGPGGVYKEPTFRC